MKNPDFIIAGEFRCGSTSLFECLIKHPEISPPIMDSDDHYVYDGGSIYLRQKEIRFFDRNWNKGVDWYRSLFPSNIVSGDGSVSYFYDQEAMKKMHQTTPNSKIIILLRNPIDRLNSHYSHFKNISERFATKYPTLEEFLLQELPDGSHQVIDRGIYIKSLKAFFRYFSKEQTTIICSEDLFLKPKETIGKITANLGVSDFNLEFKSFRTSHSKLIPQQLRSKLGDFYREYNIELYDFIGRNMGWNYPLK